MDNWIAEVLKALLSADPLTAGVVAGLLAFLAWNSKRSPKDDAVGEAIKAMREHSTAVNAGLNTLSMALEEVARSQSALAVQMQHLTERFETSRDLEVLR